MEFINLYTIYYYRFHLIELFYCSHYHSVQLLYTQLNLSCGLFLYIQTTTLHHQISFQIPANYVPNCIFIYIYINFQLGIVLIFIYLK